MALGAESWYIASGTQDLQICLDNDPKLKLIIYDKSSKTGVVRGTKFVQTMISG